MESGAKTPQQVIEDALLAKGDFHHPKCECSKCRPIKPNELIKYVVGFMFDSSMSNVALIRKNKPTWQAGLLNGIGGKVESGEISINAMCREFKEEAGVCVGTWKPFCSMAGANNDGSGFEIDFFYTIGNLDNLKSQESEKIEICVSHAITGGYDKVVGNLPWLVAMAMDFGKGVYPPTMVAVKY